MLTGETILCFAPDPWAGLWRNRHQIMTRLARGNTVIYVEPRAFLGETVRRWRAGQLRRADLARPTLIQERAGLWLYRDPVYAPHSGRLSGGPLTAWLRRRALRAALSHLGGEPPILWLLRPLHADQIGLYDEKLVVYHVTDEYSCFPSVTDQAAFARAEEALLRRADLVIVTSPALLASKRPFNPHTYLAPNAVDYEGFQTALAPNVVRADPLTHPDTRRPIGRPRIGYVGAINGKLNFDLLAAVAKARPDWQIVLLGAVDMTGHEGKADRLRGHANVHWLPRVPVEQVPAAIAGLDVCLLPYDDSIWTRHIDSLKLYEYLACGRPIVATDVPTARAFAAHLRIAADPAHFVAAIEAALTTDSPAAAAARCAVASQNTWEQRVAQIETLLGAALARKQLGAA